MGSFFVLSVVYNACLLRNMSMKNIAKDIKLMWLLAALIMEKKVHKTCPCMRRLTGSLSRNCDRGHAFFFFFSMAIHSVFCNVLCCLL